MRMMPKTKDRPTATRAYVSDNINAFTMNCGRISSMTVPDWEGARGTDGGAQKSDGLGLVGTKRGATASR